MASTFITGMGGFVGLALAEHLLRRGETVIGLDVRALPEAAQQAFASLPGKLVFEPGDVCDLVSLQDVLARHRPTRLVSLAAITAGQTRERSAPGSIAHVNVAGAWNVVAAAAACGVPRVVHASSGSVYGHSGRGTALLDEATTPLAPEALYGISKLAAEAGAQRLAELHGLDLVVARLGTCFGPWEAETGVRDTLSAPLQILRCAERGETAVLPRDSLRDWLYVRDNAAGMACLLDAPRLTHRCYNIAAGFRWALSDWCAMLVIRYPGFDWRVANADEPANIDLYASYDRAGLCWQRLAHDTGFVPRHDLSAAAHDYLAWRESQPPRHRQEAS
ncbi:NAD(P)-dependent oxidoreductase [Achromobacter sp. GG226]|uniref:NAD-dependent epimerase/dehydratase family protein n=1 Tax=Verticiella alkaliphila TaxID=2779529 RepID=UPI001C0E6CCF|nr:NAD(P)-dependent oxidoreductase [Verticiella sp. GG226]MBU4611297.1 NAD(P)-dependent oxidoreductase [Verticiella sp. GG226]